MKCPNCSVTLLISQRQNIEIDFCPECRGVWLDRGELDKIIELSMQQYVPPVAEFSGSSEEVPYRDGRNYGREDYYDRGRSFDHGKYRDDDEYDFRHAGKRKGKYGSKHGRRRENHLEWLKDLFD